MPQDPNEKWATLPDGRTVLAESFGEKLEVPEMGKPFPAPSPDAGEEVEPAPPKTTEPEVPAKPSKWDEVTIAVLDDYAAKHEVPDYPATRVAKEKKIAALRAANVTLADVVGE